MDGTITGLTEGQHGFHVHQWGVQGSEKRCIDAGGHYNPFGYNHAAPSATERHVGDLGNIQAVAATDGVTLSNITVRAPYKLSTSTM